MELSKEVTPFMKTSLLRNVSPLRTANSRNMRYQQLQKKTIAMYSFFILDIYGKKIDYYCKQSLNDRYIFKIN